MLGTVDPAAYGFVAALYPSFSLLWGFLWLLVARYYGGAAYASWRQSGGRWGTALADMTGPLTWALRESLYRWKLRPRRDGGSPQEIPSAFTPGHHLRFSIFLGSLTPSIFGLGFAFLDRSDQSLMRISIVILLEIFSILAAGGHLFLAYRYEPERWRRLCLRSLIWICISPFFFWFSLSLWSHLF